ncbi:probable transcriptional regulator SLK2 [Lactuca sativa]|uniref:LIM-domain binding protein/SEUSS n=1 Tax=Lactuca sativa TaxID=4236 RepID=A0A9R1WHM6_LACSA|nr:probable transcriptional regulator SLK2 [Lactuca sativa]KAJ0224098.1 hypothetical protein LSAT_V11C200098970 [Lactuca sativa]
MVHSSSSSGIFFEEDEHSQGLPNSHLSPYSYRNSNLVPQSMYSNMLPVSGDVSMGASSGLTMGASSLVTDANSGLSGGSSNPCIQRSASINNESYMRLPASPLSFSSNNVTNNASTATSLPNPRLGQVPFTETSMFPGSLYSDHVAKKPRLDIKHDDILQQQYLRQLLQKQELVQSQNSNAQLQALYLQSLPPGQRAHLLQQQQQQLHLRQALQQPASAVNRSYDGGVCSRRLMQYLYHQRQRPADISYWRKFVGEYYSPRAKKRWCLALHNNMGHHPSGVFSPANLDAWQCGICGSKSGRGFEATFEVLARLNEIKFSSGVIDELWFLDLPRECRFPSGIMMLEYGKAVQESVYEQSRVVREGRLKVIFTPDLKIFTWEFCSRRHEELLPRRLIANQVNQLLEVAQKWQSTIAESGSGGVLQQDLQANSNMIVAAGRQLARSLELPSVNDLGFTKTYVRCLQTAEVVNSMMDLVDITRDTKIGPIEALKSFPRMQKVQGMGMGQVSSIQGFQADRRMNNNNFQMGRGSTPPPALEYQNMLMKQRLINSNSQHEIDASTCFNNSIHNRIHVGYQQFPGLQVQQNEHHPQGGGGSKPSVSGQSAGEASRSNSYKAGSHSDSCADGEKAAAAAAADMPEFVDSMFINTNECEDGGSYGWKA